MSTNTTHTQHSSQRRYVPGSSRRTHSATTLLAQVADIERGTRIRERREELHLTQPAVVDLLEEAAKRLPQTHDLHPANAGKAPVSLRGYQTYERGGGIVWEKAKLLAGVLQMDVQAMMHGEPEQGPTPDPFPPADTGLLGAVHALLQQQNELLRQQSGLLRQQSEILDRIEKAIDRDDHVRDEIADLIAARGREIVAGESPADVSGPPQAPRRAARATKKRAAARRTS